MRALLSCFSSFSRKLISKISPIVFDEILNVFVNTWIAADKYPVQNCENLRLPIQIQLPQIRKSFSQFFVPLLEPTSNFKNFKKRMIVIANVFPKLKNLKSFVRPLSKKRRFRTRFDIKHLKVLQILAKSPRERFYHIFPSFSGRLSWKISPIVLSEILKVFVKILIAADKYPVKDGEKLRLSII